MSYVGYGRDSAGVLSAWSMVYILMNVRGKNSKNGTMAVGRPGGGMRIFALGVMGWRVEDGDAGSGGDGLGCCAFGYVGLKEEGGVYILISSTSWALDGWELRDWFFFFSL